MAYIAIITALQPRADLPAHPRASLEAGGISLLERNVRLLRHVGAETIYILTDDQFSVLAPLTSALGKDKDIKLIDTALTLTNTLADDDTVIILDEGVLLDERLIAAVAVEEQPHLIAVFSSLAPEYERAVRIDPEYSFASILKASGQTVRDVCRGLGDWDFTHTLLRHVAALPDTHMLIAANLETYVVSRRRHLPMIWQPLRTAADQSIALNTLLEAAQPHVLDWPGRFLHPPLENALVRFLLPRSVSPVSMLLLAALTGLLAMGCFAAGWLWSGLLLVLLFGPLEGATGKLAWLCVSRRRFDAIMPLLGGLLELGCYAGLAWHFYENVNKSSAWALFLIIFICRMATTALHVFYRNFTGQDLADAGALERKIQLFAGCRNSIFWALVPFALLNIWWSGTIFIALYASATFFLAQFRFFIRLKEYGVAASSVVAANFKRANYGILRRGKSSSR